MPEEVPEILQVAWKVCTPRDQPLEEQIVPIERDFLIGYAQYVNEVYSSKEMLLDEQEKELVIKDILSTAFARISLLAKEVNPALTHAVIAVVLYILSGILTNEHVKYKTQEEMLAAYPLFVDRPEAEKQNLFLTANWMNILFRVLPARKNKGIAMDIIPKFVEGNSAHYVTGGGQTQSTRDRVFIYETEGDCKPIKRVKRKSKSKLQEEAELEEAAQALLEKDKASEQPPRKKMTVNVGRDSSGSSMLSDYFPLPAPFYQATPLPIPVISPRSQSSFSQAAAVIANFGQVQPESLSSDNDNTTSNPAADNSSNSNYMVSPREGYIDVDEYGRVEKKHNPKLQLNTSAAVAARLLHGPGASGRGSPVRLPASPLFLTEGATSSRASPTVTFAPPTRCSSGMSRMSSTTSNFDMFVNETLENVEANDMSALDDAGDRQLALLREASADSDI
mmetsp:Transcript_12331/g.20066  ORF Transcript_12331/g.20066 Transcript_12331/m.20066 type:complete len:450 (-) Transcript_12331:2-1351(-)|eukprot:CAMPEP_0114428892 /NCGR_PEP_ID=MMETSP0103-20121206/9184_1 /TAXON_ID=37642 ORGANISM="Paraphysomonas imperforata, Strain PA2" /NCGR_SAMPLE_ID=MMETSP0103 /ASSEMBLY_ACC=CAM_ASM_000201 /LENGTH=449 /DNA_ID=CAMNT_0001598171 /DNA_START=73 /DNA_END=1422 /DNA_ORIENTATION=+